MDKERESEMWRQFGSSRRVGVGALALFLGIGAVTELRGQRGDREGEEQPAVWKRMEVPPAPALEPQEALESFKVAPGFRVELVASEPLIEDPVAMKWDAEGRLWAVEMRGFMPNVEGEGEQRPVGRVVVLEDMDADGRMDKSTVFLDDLVMARAIGLVEGGVLVAEPPHLWYCQDLDGDLKCDKKVSVYDDYGRQGPVEHTDNGLVRNIDNWIYNAKSSLRFKFEDGELKVDETEFRGQWGIAHDSYGRLYSNGNSSYLHVDLVPSHYLERNEVFDTDIGLTENIAENQEVHSIRVNPGINRGYRDHMLQEDGRLARTTGVSGQTIYRGEQFPEALRGNAFIPEPSGNVVSHFRVIEDGLELETEHVTYSDDEWSKREFLASTDERFRPVNAANGPDGALYIIDLYRGILQHKVYVTSFLREQILHRGLDKPLGLGRIYRVVKEGSPIDHARPSLSEASSAELVPHLAHRNGWWRDTAQRLLVQREDEAVATALREMAREHDFHLGRIHALWTLHGIGAMNKATVLDALSDTHPQVRVHGLRTSEALLGTEAEPELVDAWTGMSAPEHRAVRVQWMFSLGEAASEPSVQETMSDLLTEHAGDRFMRHAALSGLGGQEATMLQKLMERQRWAEDEDGYAAMLKQLATLIRKRGNSDEVTMVLSMAATQPAEAAWRQAALLDGLAEASKSKVELPEKPRAIALLESSERSVVTDRLDSALKGLSWPGAEGEPEATAPKLTEREKELYEIGQVAYQATCMACHQPNGKGMDGLAPPLVDSSWIKGSPERLVRIVLNGLGGPIEVKGETWNLFMPGHRESPFLTDERIAGILTYIRQEWGGNATPVHPDTVAQIREATKDRKDVWTVEDLKKVE